MIEIIAEHSVDVDLLPPKAKILDLGCRGFEFTDEMRRRGYNVLAVDIDEFDRKDYERFAISNKVGRVGVNRTKDPQATSIMEGDEIMCMDLPMLMQITGINLFDLIKIDIEGSEYEVIMSMHTPPAKQLSIEFHLHTKCYNDNQVGDMVDWLDFLGYTAVQHEKTSQHGMGYNYWDSLFILR